MRHRYVLWVMSYGRKIFVSFLLLFLLLITHHASLITSFAQTDNTQRYKDTLQLEELACKVNSPQTMHKCIEELRTIGTPIIKLIAPVICESRQDCLFDLSNISSSAIITSAKPEFKIIRKSDFGYPLFTMTNSSGINFYALYFEDENSTPCAIGTVCPPLLVIDASRNITIERSNFNKSHGTSVSIANSRLVSVIDSEFTNGFKGGLQFTTTLPTEGVVISGNNFEGNAGTAFTYQGISLTPDSTQVSNNNFINNHSKGAYENCTYPCTGSQVKISGPTANFSFKQNKIQGGINTVFDSLGLYASGIEIGNNTVSSVYLYCNEITGNRGSGVVQPARNALARDPLRNDASGSHSDAGGSPPFRDLSGIVISENKIWGNGLNLNIPVAQVDKNNCFNKDCPQACKSE